MATRDAYKIAAIAHYKKRGTQWIAGGSLAYNPVSISWIMDYVFVGDAFEAFSKILRGARDIPGMLDCRNPKIVEANYEPIYPGVFDRGLLMSTGCKRRCLFCVNTWREKYQEQDKAVVLDFVRNSKGKSVNLYSNSSNDVSYYPEVALELGRHDKVNACISNSIYNMTDEFLQRYNREILVGVEGMTESLRKNVNKPLSRDRLLESVDRCLSAGRQLRTVYQFNLPGESLGDFEDFTKDVEYIRKRHSVGSWIIPFIPHQPSSHTPLQWSKPYYSIDMVDRIMKFRKSMLGSKKEGVSVFAPSPLYPKKWFMQIIAEWIPITPKVIQALKPMENKRPINKYIEALDSSGVNVSQVFAQHEFDYVFPWDIIKTHTDKSVIWDAHQRRLKK
jgi:radical SAM superfamily enzyme YgiQ (UPF0313 family)